MATKDKLTYIHIEGCYLIQQYFQRIMSQLRPEWKRIRVCQETRHIRHQLTGDADFLLADTHLSDGRSVESLRNEGIGIPMILYTHQMDEREVREYIPNYVALMYEPVSYDDMKDAIIKLEDMLEHNAGMQGQQ